MCVLVVGAAGGAGLCWVGDRVKPSLVGASSTRHRAQGLLVLVGAGVCAREEVGTTTPLAGCGRVTAAGLHVMPAVRSGPTLEPCPP